MTLTTSGENLFFLPKDPLETGIFPAKHSTYNPLDAAKMSPRVKTGPYTTFKRKVSWGAPEACDEGMLITSGMSAASRK